MSFHRTTGLAVSQLDVLVMLVGGETTWQRKNCKPRGLALRDALKLVLMSYRQNVTQDMLAVVFEVSQPTVSNYIGELEEAIERALTWCVPAPDEAIAGRVALVDGTLAPCWSWQAHRESLYSGKHKTTGHNVQVVSDLDGEILVVSDPMPGSWHDSHAFAESGLVTIIDSNGIADLAYIGTDMASPARKPRNGELSPKDKECNQEINGLRAAVERAIAHLKTWKILHTDYRRPIATFTQTLRTVRALYFFAQTF